VGGSGRLEGKVGPATSPTPGEPRPAFPHFYSLPKPQNAMADPSYSRSDLSNLVQLSSLINSSLETQEALNNALMSVEQAPQDSFRLGSEQFPPFE
jgi:hypothetical protein